MCRELSYLVILEPAESLGGQDEPELLAATLDEADVV